MRISLIVAMDRNGLIGTGDALPWHLPGDLKRFRAVTMGKPIVLGRKTFESIARVLPGRLNIILTSNRDFQPPEGAVVARSVEEALDIAKHELERTAGDEVMIVGGAEVYRLFLPRADRIHLTIVAGEFAGTTLFPIDSFKQTAFSVTSETEYAADEKNPHSCRVLILDKSADNDSAKRFVFPGTQPT